MANRMVTVKTTIVVDEKAWTEFKRVVSSRYGGVRKLSSAVEEAIRSFNAVEMLNSFSSSMGLDASVYPSIREVEIRRPKLGTSAGEVVRRMRDERGIRISGFE